MLQPYYRLHFSQLTVVLAHILSLNLMLNSKPIPDPESMFIKDRERGKDAVGTKSQLIPSRSPTRTRIRVGMMERRT
jgi:hypothetical protein